MPDVVEQDDIVFVTESNELWVVHMVDVVDATTGKKRRVPGTVEPLDQSLQELPRFLADTGVTLGYLPDQPSPGGCSCYLLNLRSFGKRPKKFPLKDAEAVFGLNPEVNSTTVGKVLAGKVVAGKALVATGAAKKSAAKGSTAKKTAKKAPR